MKLNLSRIQDDFPILARPINGRRLVYLDSAATTLKPVSVVERISQHYLYESSNVHRGLHYLSDQATGEFEEARRKVQKFINSEGDENIVFTRGTTDSINLVAQSYAGHLLSEGEEILLTEIEHHSNIVPWQIVAERKGLKVRFIPMKSNGELDLSELDTLIGPKTKIVATTMVSNSLGTIVPVKKIIEKAKSVGALTLLDAAQAVAHMRVDVQGLGCDFLAFSGHKMFGPTGIGVLYGRKSLLDKMPPIYGGGGMIDRVQMDKTTFLDAPFRFEAGTPHIAGALGLAAAIDYIETLGIENIHEHEADVQDYALERIKEVPGLKLFGPEHHRGPILSFLVDGAHPSDIGELVDNEGVAIRSGHHCTQPIMDRLGIPGTVRASLSVYNGKSDVDNLVDSLKKARSVLG